MMYIHDMICKIDAIPESRHQYGELVSKLERDEITDIDDINNLIDEYTPILNQKVIAVCHQMNDRELIF